MTRVHSALHNTSTPRSTSTVEWVSFNFAGFRGARSCIRPRLSSCFVASSSSSLAPKKSNWKTRRQSKQRILQQYTMPHREFARVVYFFFLQKSLSQLSPSPPLPFSPSPPQNLASSARWLTSLLDSLRFTGLMRQQPLKRQLDVRLKPKQMQRHH